MAKSAGERVSASAVLDEIPAEMCGKLVAWNNQLLAIIYAIRHKER